MVSFSGAAGNVRGLESASKILQGFGGMAQREKEFNANDEFRKNEASAKTEQIKLKKFNDDFKSAVGSLKEYRNGIYAQNGGVISPETKAKLDESITSTISTYVKGAQLMQLPPATQKTMMLMGQALLEQPSPQQTATTAGNVAGTTALATTSTVAEGLGVSQKTAAQGQGLLPADVKDPQIQTLMNARDELMSQGNIADAKSVQAQIDALGASTTVDPRTVSKENNIDKIKRELVDIEVNQKNINGVGSRLISLLDEGGEAAIDLPGKLAQGLTGLSSAFTGVAQNLGVDMTRFESGASVDDRMKMAESILGKSSGISAEIRSTLVDLAYAAAAAQGQTGKAVSDKDFENNIRQLGSGSGGVKNFRSVMISFLKRNNDKLSNKHEGLNSLLSPDARRQTPSFDTDFSKKTESTEITDEGYKKLKSGDTYVLDGVEYKKK